MDRGEFQGRPAHAHARRPDGTRRSRQLSRQDLRGQGRERESGYRVAVLRIATRKRYGKLGQGGAEAARAGGDRTSRSGVSAAWRLKRQRQRRYSASAPSFRIGRSDCGQRLRCNQVNAAAAVGSGTARAPHRGLITLSVMLASIMQALDNTIANVALPRIQGSLSATQDQMAWVLTSYIIAAAIMTPLSGWLAGQIGRKRVFLTSIIGFTIASALCGLAQSLPEIVIARLLQGLCGAALIPMSQAVLLDINPPERHAKAMALWVTAVTIGPILGPALGGWLTENYNWRWVFYINVPFGILSFLGILTFMPETQLRKSRFDFLGFTALSLAIGAFQLMLDRGQLKDWFSSTEIWVEAIVAGISFYLFVVHMFTTSKPTFVSAALFKDRNFVTGNVFIFIV